MKLNLQTILGLLFCSTFIKSFFYSSNLFDIVFIVMITITYLSRDYLTEQKTRKELEKLTSDIDLRFKQQDEEIERAKNAASKSAVAMGFKR